MDMAVPLDRLPGDFMHDPAPKNPRNSYQERTGILCTKAGPRLAAGTTLSPDLISLERFQHLSSSADALVK